MKTSELTGAALDWAVSKCEGQTPIMRHDYMRHRAAINNYTGDLAWHLYQQPNEAITVNSEGRSGRLWTTLDCYTTVTKGTRVVT